MKLNVISKLKILSGKKDIKEWEVPVVTTSLIGMGISEVISWERMHEVLPVVVSGCGIGLFGGIGLSYYIIKNNNLVFYNPFKQFTRYWFYSAATIVGVTSVLFIDVLHPNLILFSNDGPFGVMASQYFNVIPATPVWNDLHWLGSNGGLKPVSISSIITYLLGPIYYSKFYPLIVTSFSGICGLIMFRTLGIRYLLSTVAAITISLNANFFSNACWGVGSRSTVLGLTMLAVALNETERGHWLIRHILMGSCLGMAIVEGADNGVIMCLLFSAYYLYRILARDMTLVK